MQKNQETKKKVTLEDWKLQTEGCICRVFHIQRLINF